MSDDSDSAPVLVPAPAAGLIDQQPAASRKRRIIDDADSNAELDESSLVQSVGVSLIPSSEKRVAAADESNSINLEVLKVYYDRLFPVSLLIHWMRPSGSNDSDSVRLREFSFTLVDDIYIRYLSFGNRDELKAALTSRVPIKIDLGACYNSAPTQRNSVNNFIPLQKDLVFDIDMTDYDDVRNCCSGAGICTNCWPLMSAAIRVLDTILRENFGFEHILWVYSGRRGVHCWVSDERARKLSNELRSSIVDFLTVYLGKEGGKDGRKLNLNFPLHATLQRSYETLMPYFRNYIDAQHLFEDEKSLNSLLDYFDSAVRADFLFSGKSNSGIDRWDELVAKVDSNLRKWNSKSRPAYVTQAAISSVRTSLQRIVFSHVYPRLDVNVSRQLNHLLKSPFCVHPKSGRVCVPIDPINPDKFDPFTVPTLSQLEKELNNYKIDETHPANAAWMETSLKSSLELFREFVKKLLEAESRKYKYEEQMRKNEEKMHIKVESNNNTNEQMGVHAW